MKLSPLDEGWNGPIDYPHKSNELDDSKRRPDETWGEYSERDPEGAAAALQSAKEIIEESEALRRKEWSLSRRYGRDMHSDPFVEAICAHAVGRHKGVHGCDGCCPAPKEMWDKVSEDV
jgi:hypothetical protein